MKVLMPNLICLTFDVEKQFNLWLSIIKDCGDLVKAKYYLIAQTYCRNYINGSECPIDFSIKIFVKNTLCHMVKS